MKSTFITILLLCGSLIYKGTAQTSFLDDYKIKWENATEYTLEFAQAMPEDRYSYTPTKVEMTFREQLKHVAGNIIWLCSSFLDGEHTTLDPTQCGDSKKEVIAMLEKSFAYANKTIHQLTEKDLEEHVDFVAGTMTKRRMLFLLTDHVTHHRGQLVVYLRLNNIEPPRYRGW